MELYKTKKRNSETRWRHASKYNNKADCEANEGKWINFHNYLEILPDKTKDECKGESVIWAIPYRSEDIDQLEGKDPEMWKKCLVKLTAPDCIEAPKTRTNHLGNGKGIVPVTYNWILPHFPSGQEQRCILRIRYVYYVIESDITNVSSDKVKTSNIAHGYSMKIATCTIILYFVKTEYVTLRNALQAIGYTGVT